MCADAFVFEPNGNPAMYRARERSLLDALAQVPRAGRAFQQRQDALEAPTQPVELNLSWKQKVG